MLDLLVGAKNACVDALRPQRGATSRQIRKDGAVAAAIGLLLVLVTGGAPIVLERLQVGLVLVSRGLLALMLLAYGLFVIGGYRLVTGKGVEQTRHGAGASLGRIVFGVLFVFGTMGVLTGLLILVGYAVGMK